MTPEQILMLLLQMQKTKPAFIIKDEDTEQQLKNINEQIHFTGQYLFHKDLLLCPVPQKPTAIRNKFYEHKRNSLFMKPLLCVF